MGDILSWGTWLAGFITAVIGAAYIITAVVSLDQFTSLFWLGRGRPEPQGIKAVLTYLWIAILVLSVGRFLHGGFAYVVNVIPANWGGADDDGDWQSFRSYIHFLLDVYATVIVVTRTQEEAHSHADQKEREARAEKLKGAIPPL